MPHPALSFRLGQRPCLDGLRGLAVMSVVAAHLGLIPGGVVGVDVLFALSGFLITVLLVEEWEKNGAISLASFYRKRFLRVLPPLVAMLLVGGLVAIALGIHTPSTLAREAALALTFFSNWHTIHQTPLLVFGHTWTLSLEVQFYLIWPVALTLLLVARASKNLILGLLIAGIIASAALRIGLFTLLPMESGQRREYATRLFTGLDTHADALLAGCLAGFVVVFRMVPTTVGFQRWLRLTGWFALALLIVMTWRCHHEQFIYYYGLALALALATALQFVWWITDLPRFLWLLERPALVGLGRISYGVYLFHMPLIQFFRPLRETWGKGTTAVVITTLSLALAILSYYAIERPVLSLRHQRPNSDAGKPRLPAQAA